MSVLNTKVLDLQKSLLNLKFRNWERHLASLKNLFLVLILGITISGCGTDNPALLENSGTGDSEVERDSEIENPPAPPLPVTPSLGSPESDADFGTLSNGKNLSSIKVSGIALRLIKGTGNSMSDSKYKEYLKLKADSQNQAQHAVQWSFANLETGEIISRSASAHKKYFGASSSKIFVGAAQLDKNNGNLTNSQLQQMADMIVVSSNTAWTNMQKDIGGGDSNKGRERVHQFTQRMGYTLTRGFQGYWGSVHGNELVPDETVEMLYDTYFNQYPGADTLWKMMYTCRTGASRGLKYIPSHIYVGGKTGTYSGPTENPETGRTHQVNMRNHVLTFNIHGVQYGLAIFANNGSDESVALLAGGLVKDLL